MPDEENPPISPKEPTEQPPENTRVSDSSEPSPEPQEAQGSDFEPKVERG